MESEIRKLIEGVAGGGQPFVVEATKDQSRGDYASNVAIVAKLDAVALVAKIATNKPAWLEKIEVAGPGFLNFYLTSDFIAKKVAEIVTDSSRYGSSESRKAETV